MATRQGKETVNDAVHDEGSGTVQESAEAVVIPLVETANLEITTVDGVYEARLSTEFTVNLGDYNSKKFGGSYSGRFSTMYDAKDIGEHLGDKLYDMLNDEILAVQELAFSKSYIHNIITN
jgi:hypothetical protein